MPPIPEPASCPLCNLTLELSLADGDLRGALASEYRIWREAIADRIRRDRELGGASMRLIRALSPMS